MHIEELKPIFNTVPIEYKYILDDNTVFINWHPVQQQINGLFMSTFYKDKVYNNNTVGIVNFYVDDLQSTTLTIKSVLPLSYWTCISDELKSIISSMNVTS